MNFLKWNWLRFVEWVWQLWTLPFDDGLRSWGCGQKLSNILLQNRKKPCWLPDCLHKCRLQIFLSVFKYDCRHRGEFKNLLYGKLPTAEAMLNTLKMIIVGLRMIKCTIQSKSDVWISSKWARIWRWTTVIGIYNLSIYCTLSLQPSSPALFLQMKI